MNDLLKFKPDKLAKEIFSVKDDQNRKILKIKKFTFDIQEKKLDLLQIWDITDEHEKTQGEKKLLSLINATVSHEMRTPINSINAQNVQLQFLVDLIGELLTSSLPTE